MTKPELAAVPPITTHPNAQLIEKLYSGIQAADAATITSCYAEDAYFEDIAFNLDGRARIADMWQFICHNRPKVIFDRGEIQADDRSGHGKWHAFYHYGANPPKPGRPVDNTLRSEFEFRNGLIVKHYDRSSALCWASQAFAFPISLLVGWVGPVRRYAAKKRLDKFIASRPSLALAATLMSAVAIAAAAAAAVTGASMPFVSGTATHKMTIYPESPYGDKRAVLVVLHGNAGLNPPFAELIHGFAKELAARDYVVAVPQYYANDAQHLTDDNPHPHVQVLSDALAKLAERKDADVTRLGLVGYSLGAATAMTYIASQPAGTTKVLVDFFGPVLGNAKIAGGADKFPPTIILHNQKDKLVLIDHTDELIRLLKAKAIEHRFVPNTEDNPQFLNHPFVEGGTADVDSRKQATEWIGKHLAPK